MALNSGRPLGRSAQASTLAHRESNVVSEGEPLPPAEPPLEPEDIDTEDELVPAATYKIPDTTASPGEVVAVPIIVRANLPMVGMAIALDFDEEILEVVGVEMVYSDRWWTFNFLFDNVNENPGNDRIEEGALRAFTAPYPPPGVFPGGDIPQFTRPVADQDHEIFHIHFRVKDETPVGTVTVLSFPDVILIQRTLWDGTVKKVESWNVVTLHQGLAGGIGVTPTYEVKPLVVPGQLQIVGQLILFFEEMPVVTGWWI